MRERGEKLTLPSLLLTANHYRAVTVVTRSDLKFKHPEAHSENPPKCLVFCDRRCTIDAENRSAVARGEGVGVGKMGEGYQLDGDGW